MQYSIGTEVSNWLHQRLWKDHHLRLAERIPLHSRGQIYGGQSVALRRCAECRWSGSGTIDLISGDFHFAVRRLNPGNNSLREIPIKEAVALPSEQFYLTTELSTVVASHSFLEQSYCSLRVSAVSWQSDHTAICLSSVCRLLLFAADQVSSAVYRIWSTPGIAKRRAFLWPVSFSHIVFVLTVSILALVKTPGNHLLNALISDYPLHFLFS